MPTDQQRHWQPLAPRVREEDIFAFLSALPEETTRPYGRCNFAVVQFILQRFMGWPWVQRNIFVDVHNITPRTGFLEMDFSSDGRRESQTQRMLDLAEMLFNLQGIRGVDDCIDRLQTGNEDQVEATFAELQFGKLLHGHALDFRFVVPSMLERGYDYDFEIRFPDGEIACGEAKCKLEGREVNVASVLRSLRRAARQLPKHRPGIIFVKVPQHWFEGRPQMPRELREVAAQCLRNTRRVVSIKFYVSHVALANQTTLQRHLYDEISNEHTRFASRDWTLFQRDGNANWKWLMEMSERWRQSRFGSGE